MSSRRSIYSFIIAKYPLFFTTIPLLFQVMHFAKRNVFKIRQTFIQSRQLIRTLHGWQIDLDMHQGRKQLLYQSISYRLATPQK